MAGFFFRQALVQRAGPKATQIQCHKTIAQGLDLALQHIVLFDSQGKFLGQYFQSCHVAMMTHTKLTESQICQHVFGGLNLSQ